MAKGKKKSVTNCDNGWSAIKTNIHIFGKGHSTIEAVFFFFLFGVHIAVQKSTQLEL